MKMLITVFLFLFVTSCANSKDVHFTASTPASPLVREFLGISLTDSIDFIRWNLTLNDLKYAVECNYGIGKPNTNGFKNGGFKKAFSEPLREKIMFIPFKTATSF